MKKLSNINRRVKNALEIPREVVGKGILEYEDFFVRISTYIGVVSINGFNLKLSQMTEDDILVSGKIESIDLEAKE